jgi:hypothetical protein
MGTPISREQWDRWHAQAEAERQAIQDAQVELDRQQEALNTRRRDLMYDYLALNEHARELLGEDRPLPVG